ncbi:glycosyltransferase family 2 protein [Marinomonas sp.]
MNKAKKISVIVPVYNNEEYIESCLKSITSQTFRDFELIVIDGGSIDNTNRIIDKYKENIDSFVSEKDNGIYDAMNKGIKRSTGDWLIFLGSDDRLYGKDVLHDIFHLLNFDNGKVIFGNVIYDNGEKFMSSLDWRILLRNTLHHQSAFYHKSLFNGKGFSSEYSILADYEINLVAYLRKCKVKYIDINIAQCSELGISKNVDFQGYLQEMMIRKKHLSFVFSYILNFSTLLKFAVKKISRLLKK